MTVRVLQKTWLALTFLHTKSRHHLIRHLTRLWTGDLTLHHTSQREQTVEQFLIARRRKPETTMRRPLWAQCRVMQQSARLRVLVSIPACDTSTSITLLSRVATCLASKGIWKWSGKSGKWEKLDQMCCCFLFVTCHLVYCDGVEISIPSCNLVEIYEITCESSEEEFLLHCVVGYVT